MPSPFFVENANSSLPVDQYPASLEVFSKVCQFYRQQAGQAEPLAQNDTKKRKFTTAVVPQEDPNYPNQDAAITIPNVSVSMPVRKKLDLLLTASVFVARKSDTETPEFVLNYRTDTVEAAFILDVPEKTKPQWNLVVVFTRQGGDAYEFFQVTLFEETIKTVIKPIVGEQYSGSLKDMLLLYFQRRDISIISNETIERGESLFQVTAHRGSKDGLLYFLPTHIFFGFKKPLLLFRLQDIQSVSYSSITRSTFNVVVKYTDRFTTEENEIEFSIIDQSHYDQINQYVSLKELHNDSLSEKRKAKTDTKALYPAELVKAKQEAKVNGDRELGTSQLAALNGYEDEDDEDDEDFNSDVADQQDSGSASGSDENMDDDDDDDEDDDEDEEEEEGEE